MLRESQAAELLAYCEALAGRRLVAVRGNLRRAKTRSAAVWELLVTEALAQLGKVSIEAPKGGPDVHLQLPSGRAAWVEVTYVRPRFEKQDRVADLVVDWLRKAVVKRFGPETQVGVEYLKDEMTPAGPTLRLPKENERTSFLRNEHLAALFAAYAADPRRPYVANLNDYSMRITIAPPGAKVLISNGGRPVLDAPWKVEEHALFRKLQEKRKQHDVPGPRIIFIGSDTSSVLSEMNQRLSHANALQAALGSRGEISGVAVAEVAYRHGTHEKSAVWKLYPVVNAREPLTAEEVNHLLRLDLNRWRYTFPLVSDSRGDKPYRRSVSGPISRAIQRSTGSMKLNIPVPALLDALAGRKSLKDAVAIPGMQPNLWDLDSLLGGTHTILSCEVIPGNQRTGVSATVVLEVGPSHDLVYWPDDGTDDRA